METKPDSLANPCLTKEANNYADKTAAALLPEFRSVYHPGLTIRQHFAGLAMQGLLTNYVANGHYGNHESFPLVEEMAVSCADRLINELNKSK